MFRISFFVEDKALATVLRHIAGAGPKDLQVVPVANLETKPDGKVEQTSHGTFDGFIQALRKSGAEINADSARAACAKSGASIVSYSYYLRKAIQAGLIKQKGQGVGCTYEWKA